MLKKVINNGDETDYQHAINETVREMIAQEQKNKNSKTDEVAYERHLDEITKERPHMKQAMLLCHFMSNAMVLHRGEPLLKETLSILTRRLNMVFEDADYYVFFPKPDDLYVRKEIKKEPDFNTRGISRVSYEAYAKKEYKAYSQKQLKFHTEGADLGSYFGEKVDKFNTLVIPFADVVPDNVYGMLIMAKKNDFVRGDLEKANLIGRYMFDFFYRYSAHLPWTKEPQ